VRLLLERGAYADADREATDLSVRIGAGNTVGSRALPAPLLDLLVETRVANGKAGDATTMELARNAVDAATGAAEASADLATALHNLGSVHFERGEFTTALADHQRALAIRRRDGGVSQALADSLDLCSLTEIRLGRYPAARKRIDESLAIRESWATETPLALARTLEVHATWLRYKGDFSQALNTLDRVYALRVAAAAQPFATTTWLNVRGDAFFLKGDVRAAQQAWSEGLALAEATLDLLHPRRALFLRKLALAADAFGERNQSRALIARAMSVGLSHLPPCHPEALGLVNDSALSAERDGDFPGARNLYRQHLGTLEKCGANADWTASALHNLGSVAV
jgi:tetratricopeptide (TPR) repeat protein